VGCGGERVKKLTNRAALFAVVRALEQAEFSSSTPTIVAGRVCVSGGARL
jgi:hypothetical protein